jgi:hypothetical protein
MPKKESEIHLMFRVTLLCCFVVLTGCTMLGVPVSEFEASRYDSIQSFIAGNFTKGPESIFAEGNEEMKKSGVLWDARFNEMNETYLNKPSKDLKTYCLAIGGSIHNIPEEAMSRVLSIDAKQVNVLEAQESVLRSYRSMFGEGLGGYLAAHEMAEAVLKHNVTAANDARLAYDVLDRAYRDGRLGYYSCTQGDDLLWLASIKVVNVDIGSRSTNMMEMPKAILHIVGSGITKP